MAEIEIPSYFVCPITLDIMRDPVTLWTGITYERESIEEWIFTQKNRSCPATKQLLHDNLDLTPNTTLRRLIQSWCTLHATHGVERLPTPKAPVTRPHLLKLLRDAARPHLQSHSLQTLKSIASQSQTNKRCMESAGAAEFLAKLIVAKSIGESTSDEDRKTCDDALSIIYTLQLSESGLKTLNSAEFIETLTLIMQQGSYESRAYAIMLLKSMLEVADPSLQMGLKSELFTEIAHILNDGVSSKGSKAALKLLICACPWGRNRIKAVEAGVVSVLIDLLVDSTDKRASEMMLVVLDMLCQCADGRAEVLGHAAGLAVVSKKIMRVSQAASERAVRILHSISRFSATPGVLAEMLQIGVVAKLCLILQVDSGSKTKEKAREILKTHAKAWRHSPCIPTNFISSYPS